MPLSTAQQIGAIRWIAAGGLSILLLLMWTSQFTERAVNDDAAQSVRMGYNLAHHGVISVDRTAPFLVTNYREPFPAWVHALSMSAMESVMGRVPIEAYDSGPRLKYLKWENVFWLGMLSVVAFLSVRGLTGSFWFALAAVACLNVTFRPDVGGGSVDDLMTEIPASAVLVAASFVLSVAFMRGTARHFVLAGLLFGVLALIKAVVLYVFMGVAVLLLAAGLLTRRRSAAAVISHTLALVVAFGCVVGPWIYRNHVLLGTTQITQRGGEGLYERALVDRINSQEYAGTLYFWAPSSLRGWLGRRLHFSEADLQRGGRLQRLNDDPSSPLSTEDLAGELAGKPDQTVTFYRQARARRIQLVQAFEAAGESMQQAYVDADQRLQSQAIAMIEEAPAAHLALITPYLWRGAARILPLILLVLVVALARSRYQLIVFVLPALAMVLTYATFITFFPRYGVPMYDLSILAASVAAWELWAWTRQRLFPEAPVKA